MANATVTKVSELLLTNVTAGVDAGKGKVSDVPGFSEAMISAKDEVAKTQSQKGDNPAAGKDTGSDVTKTTRTVVGKQNSKEIKSEEPVRKDPIANEEDMKELTEEVAEEVASIVNTIKEILGIDEDDIKTAMENLGITEVDLLDPVSIKDLCMELTGTTDSISLLTNGELYENVKQIVSAAEDAGAKILADFGMTKEELSEVFEDETFADAVKTAVTDLTIKSKADDLQNTAGDPGNMKINDQLPIQDKEVEDDAVVTKTNAENKDTAAAEGREATTVTVEVNREEIGKDIRVREDARPVTEPKVAAPEEEGTPAQEVKPVQTGSVTETFKPTVKTENSSLKGNEEVFENVSKVAESETVGVGAAGQTTVVTSEINNLGEVVETVRTYSNADADSIMDQVTTSIRVNYTAETTSMEMQLHPASLGTVNMHIASTGGVVTAHILVENEAVKAALESQLITLQQTFEDQGQKVEAVEVSVANYDLNRGGSSDTGSDAKEQGTTRTGRVGTRRRINLNDLDEEDIEELSDEEKITADMMARSGNSVDYTA